MRENGRETGIDKEGGQLGWRDEYPLVGAHGPQGHCQRSEEFRGGVGSLVRRYGGQWSKRDFRGSGGIGGLRSHPSSPLTCLLLTSGISTARIGAWSPPLP